MMLWLKYREKNLASHRYIGMFLFLLQISVGIFLILQQNSTSVASERLIAIWNLRPYLALQRVFYHVTFSNFRYCSSEKYWLTELYRSLNVDTLHYTISKIIIVFLSPLISPENSLNTRKLSSLWQQIQVFQNSEFA